MKYSEFKVEVEKLGFVVDDSSTPIYVDKNEDGETLLSISRLKQFWLDPGWSGFEALDEGQKLGLYALGYQLAKTPLAEREEEKKYYLRLATKIDVYEDRRYLNMDIPNEKYTLSENKDDAYYKAIFTESEISQIDITGFVKVEVTPE